DRLALTAPGERRHLGAVFVCEPRPRGRAARAMARRVAGDPRARPRPRRSRVPLARRVRLERPLERRHGELPRVLPLPHRAPAPPGFGAVVDVHPARSVPEPHPTFSSQPCESRAGGERGQFHLLYPNTGINVFPGPANLSIGPIVPTAPGRTERYLDYFFSPV